MILGTGPTILCQFFQINGLEMIQFPLSWAPGRIWGESLEYASVAGRLGALAT